MYPKEEKQPSFDDSDIIPFYLVEEDLFVWKFQGMVTDH